MKKEACLISLLLIGLSFCGCYPVHSIEQYSSREKYYKEANSAFEGKEVKVSLAKFDSVFYAEDAVIRNDSISLTTLKKWEDKTLYWKDIVSTAYYNKDYANLCAQFKLKSGEIINAEYIKVNPDSSIECQVFNLKTLTLPISDIKNIRYKNYYSIPAGFFIGLFSGILIGQQLMKDYKQTPTSDPNIPDVGHLPHDDGFGYLFGCVVLGPIAGTTIGWIVGGRTTWEFSK